mmetsp:Transcript_42437/g.100910  ORF Transcript_42437/g.100910 Transcript_42437/m.100910 type:complete len:204 (+) Transcript_42437:2894-3505(+)
MAVGAPGEAAGLRGGRVAHITRGRRVVPVPAPVATSPARHVRRILHRVWNGGRAAKASQSAGGVAGIAREGVSVAREPTFVPPLGVVGRHEGGEVGEDDRAAVAHRGDGGRVAPQVVALLLLAEEVAAGASEEGRGVDEARVGRDRSAPRAGPGRGRVLHAVEAQTRDPGARELEVEPVGVGWRGFCVLGHDHRTVLAKAIIV